MTRPCFAAGTVDLVSRVLTGMEITGDVLRFTPGTVDPDAFDVAPDNQGSFWIDMAAAPGLRPLAPPFSVRTANRRFPWAPSRPSKAARPVRPGPRSRMAGQPAPTQPR